MLRVWGFPAQRGRGTVCSGAAQSVVDYKPRNSFKWEESYQEKALITAHVLELLPLIYVSAANQGDRNGVRISKIVEKGDKVALGVLKVLVYTYVHNWTDLVIIIIVWIQGGFNRFLGVSLIVNHPCDVANTTRD